MIYTYKIRLKRRLKSKDVCHYAPSYQTATRKKTEKLESTKKRAIHSIRNISRGAK